MSLNCGFVNLSYGALVMVVLSLSYIKKCINKNINVKG
jgi:hypothetical protein